MALQREPIFEALFTRLQSATAGTVKYWTRRLEGWDTTAPPMEPALCLIKGGERPNYPANGVGAIWLLSAHILVYVRDDGSNESVIDPRFNAIMTAIEGALEMQPGETPSNGRPAFPPLAGAPASTTLGGLCAYCRISGDVEVYQGVISNSGFLKIPVEILATA